MLQPKGSPRWRIVPELPVPGSKAPRLHGRVGEARQYPEKVVEGLDHGDRLVLLEVYRTGSRDSVGRFVQDMPEPIRAGAVTSYDRREPPAAGC